LRATVLSQDETSYLVQYSDGSTEIESRNTRNKLCFETDVFDSASEEFTLSGRGHYDGDGDGYHVELTFTLFGSEDLIRVSFDSGADVREVRNFSQSQRDRLLSITIDVTENTDRDDDKDDSLFSLSQSSAEDILAIAKTARSNRVDQHCRAVHRAVRTDVVWDGDSCIVEMRRVTRVRDYF
jgi:hypothetical protein